MLKNMLQDQQRTANDKHEDGNHGLPTLRESLHADYSFKLKKLSEAPLPRIPNDALIKKVSMSFGKLTVMI